MAIQIIDAFETEAPPPDFVLPGFLKGTVGILTSAGGVGKSFWTLEASMSIASKDANILRLPDCTTGAVCILNAEDPADILRRRLHAIGKHLSLVAKQELVNNYILEDLFGRGCDMMNPKWQESITNLLLRNRARLCVLDTLSRWHRLDENSNSDMGQLMAVLEYIARQTGASILLLHHVSKGMAKDGRQDEQQSARGASLLVDNARWQAWMAGMTKPEAETYGVDESCRGYFVRFGISKQNYGTPFDDVWYRRHDGGVLLPAHLDKKGKDNGKKGSKRDEL